MEISSSDEFGKQLEAAINEIGRENAKVLTAQVKAIVEQIRSGSTEKTILVWTYDNCPEALRVMVDGQFQADEVEWVVLYPINYRDNWLTLGTVKDSWIECAIHRMQLPLQTLMVYYRRKES